jgi:hypothetical protein
MYRMTSKPAPTRPSPFMSTSLQPFRAFRQALPAAVPAPAAAAWVSAIGLSVAERCASGGV